MNYRISRFKANALLCTTLLFAMLVFMALPVLATTYYVNNDTGVDGNSGAIDAPWKTIDYGDAAAVLVPGDTVIVQAGTYVPATENGVWLQNVNASAASPVTYQAQGSVVIDMSSFNGAASAGFFVQVNGVVIDGFEIKGANDGVFAYSVNDITVKNCTIHDSRMTAMESSGVWAFSCDNALITHNVIYNIQSSPNAIWGSAGAGVQLSGPGSKSVINNTIDNCYLGVLYYGNMGGGGTFGHATTQNNILTNIAGWGFVNPWSTDPSLFTCSNNLVFNCATTYGNFPAGNNGPYPSDVTSNPKFYDRLAHNYHLVLGSPALGAGLNPPSPDMGALEGGVDPPPNGSITGTVSANLTGNPPVRGATVQTLDGVFTTTTDANGNYTLNDLPAGSTTLKVTSLGMADATGTVTVPPGDVATLNFSLDATTTATTYYVDDASGSDSNPGTLAAPWKTINHGDVANILNPGDTVIVGAGTYVQADANGVAIANRHGYAFAPIIYKTDGAVLIDQSGFTGDSYGFKVSVAGIVIDGFEIKGARVGVQLDAAASDSAVNGCTIHDLQAVNQDATGVFIGAADNVLLTRNVIYNVYDDTSIVWDKVGSGIRTQSTTRLKVFNNTIDRCWIGVFYLGAGIGSGPYGDVTLKNNIVSNCPSTNEWGWGIVDPWGGGGVSGSNNLYFNNHIDGNTFPNTLYGQDPLFVNRAAGNFALQDASPAINAGVDVGLPFNSWAPEIGAIESTYEAPPTTYYVDDTSGSDSNPGTLAAPWKTINHGDVVNILNPGDTVIVSAGTYAQADGSGVVIANRRGFAAGPITYKADGHVLIDQSGFTGDVYGFKVSVAGIAIDGFEIKHARVGVQLESGASDCSVNGCTIHDLNSAGQDSAGVFVGNAADVLLTRNVIYNVYDPTCTVWGQLGVGIRTASSPNLKVFNNTIDTCYIGVFYTGAGIGDGGPHGVVTLRNNIISNCPSTNDWGWGVVNPWHTAAGSVTGSNNLFFNNHSDMGLANPGELWPGNLYGSDPLFVNRAAGDFSLQNTSLAINAGVDVGLLFNGRAPDMGGIESSFAGCTVSGRVTANVAGNPPVRNALVKAWGGTYSTHTDGNGNYSFDVDPGDIPLTVSALGMSWPDGPVQTVAGVPGGAVTKSFILDMATTAKTYYVDNAAGSDTNPGTLVAPWKTINNGDVKNILSPGDTVIVKGGTYAQADANGVVIANRHGYSFAPITYKTDGTVVIDQNGFSGDSYGFKVAASGITIDGFEIKGSRVGVQLDAAASDCTVKGCTIHDLKAAGQDASGVFIGAADNVLLARNVIYNVYDAGSIVWGPLGSGVRTSSTTRLKVFNNTIDTCYIGVFYYGSSCPGDVGPHGDLTLTNNIITNCPTTNDWGWAVVNPWHTAAGSVIGSNNFYYGNHWDIGLANGGVPFAGDIYGADPLYVDRAAGNFALQSGSPAIDAGALIGLDYQGLAPDMGAIEFPYSGPPIVPVNSLADLGSLTTGTPVSLTVPLVVTVDPTTSGDTSYYIEEEGRTSGIKVMGGIAVPGDRVTLAATLLTDSNGEKLLAAARILTKTPGTALGALAMNNKALGGGPGIYQPGITGASGGNNIGLLVTVFGKVINPGSNDFYLDDGSSVNVHVVLPTGYTVPGTDAYVSITGISSCEMSGSDINRLFKAVSPVNVIVPAP
ncbi:MAG: right-handed parallel beta-helix repeat-containing protein [Armatimonadota bacterium]